MGTDIGNLLVRAPFELSSLSHKVIAIDAYNTLYQFLSIIRQKDGTPLKDSNGIITSHLSGILYRITNLMEYGIKPVFVFDGKAPELKSSTNEKRAKIRDIARANWIDAKEQGLAEEAFKYAQASSKVDADIVSSSKRLLLAMGIPFVDAPSEGEAQAAYMVSKGDADYVASQDYDSLVFGAPLVIRNLTISGKRKLPNKKVYLDVKPELIILQETLDQLEINHDQLIDIALCVGTDYNEGIEGFGPKKALKMIKKYGSMEKLLLLENQKFDELDAIRSLFKAPVITDNYQLEWKKPDKNEILNFLCDKHDFSHDRVLKAIEKLDASSGNEQKTLDQWL
jgi:flap endonuclease-1